MASHTGRRTGGSRRAPLDSRGRARIGILIPCRYAERALVSQLKAAGRVPDEVTEMDRVYAIGDNPTSDVRGANNAGGHFRSILVRTGCFQGGENDPIDPAWRVCDNVLEAVRLILAEEGVN